jgi:4-amino-4-deoxy-L-arabinose transferase-like glycosyltransferase
VIEPLKLAAGAPSSTVLQTEKEHFGRVIVLCLVLLAILWFGGLGYRKLIKPDEGRYAEIPREMVASGDWLTPRLNGLKYFEKPPLQYWTTAVAYEVFGLHEWTSRLWTALTGFCGVLLVGFTTTRLHDRRTGLVAAIVLASSLAYVLLAHFNTLDMGLTFFMTLTVCAVLLARAASIGAAAVEAHCGGGSSNAGAKSAANSATTPPMTTARRWMLVAWAALALATLSKGPVAVVLCGGALVVYLALSRDWALLSQLAPVRGLALFVLIAGPWFVAVSRANPSFAHFFFIHEHVERFLTTEHRREGPLWYFVPIVVVGTLPWLTLMPKALMDAWRAPPRQGFAPQRLLIGYAAIVFVFFSLSGSKLPSYVLPMFPALAMLLAPTLARIDARVLQRHLVCVALVALAVTIAFFFVPLDSASSAVDIGRFRIAAFVAMLPWLIGTVVAIVLAARRRLQAALLATGVAALFGWSALLIAHETLGRGMSTYDLALAMKPSIGPDTPIYSVGTFENTLDFYLRRTVTLVAFRDELDFGLAQEPALGIPTFQAFIDRWNADRAPLAVMGEDVFAKLSAADVPMRVVARDGRRVVVAKPVAR